jgi:hypothetical protein
MWIIGVDYHPSVQQIAFVNTDTGECGERRLSHSDGEAEKFYRELKAAGCKVRVGMEATGHARWFERLLAELGFELWIGDPAQIKAKRGAKAEDGPPGCCATAAIAAGGSLSSSVGAQVRKIEICVSCCGIGIGWYRCGRGS